MGYYITGTYPVQFNVDYSDGPMDRVSTFFRLIFLIPIGVVAAIITSAVGLWQYSALLIMILFRQKYPRWWFDWFLASLQFSLRVQAYVFLMRDEYPSTDEEQAVHLDVAYPDAGQDLNRIMPLFKWLLAIPHWIALIFLALLCPYVVAVSAGAVSGADRSGSAPRPLEDTVVLESRRRRLRSAHRSAACW